MKYHESMSLCWSLEEADRRMVVLMRNRLGDEEAFVSNIAMYYMLGLGTSWNMRGWSSNSCFAWFGVIWDEKFCSQSGREKSYFWLSTTHWKWECESVMHVCVSAGKVFFAFIWMKQKWNIYRTYSAQFYSYALKAWQWHRALFSSGNKPFSELTSGKKPKVIFKSL